MKLSTWRGAVVWRERAHFHTQYLFERAYVRRFVLSLHRWLTICLSVFKHWTLVKEEWIQKRAVQAPRLVGNFILCWVEKTTSFSLYEYIFFYKIKSCHYLVFGSMTIFCPPINQFIIQGQFKAAILFVGYLNAVAINWSRHVYIHY